MVSRFQFYYLLRFFKDMWNAFEVKKKWNGTFWAHSAAQKKGQCFMTGYCFLLLFIQIRPLFVFFVSCLRFFYLILKVISLDKLQTCFALKISCIHHLSQKILIPSLIYFLLVTQKVSNKTSETKSHKTLPHFKQNAQQRCMQNRRCFLCYL